MEFYFKELIVWQKSMQLVRLVYQVLKTFPSEERFALTDQLRRAVISIPSNIAEGNGRGSNKDYAHFLAIARGSLYETMTQVQIACDLGYIKKDVTFHCSPSSIQKEQPSTVHLHLSPSPSLPPSTFTLNDLETLATEIGCMLGSMLKKYGAIKND